MFPAQVFPPQVFTDKVFPKLFAPVAILTAPGVSYVILVEIDWEFETRLYGFEGISTPAGWYKDRVLSIGTINREAPAIGSDLMISDCEIVFSNLDREFSTLKATRPFRNIPVRIKFGTTSTGYSGFTTIYSGRISNWRILNGTCVLTIRDFMFDQLNGALGGFLNPTDFPTVPIDQFTDQLEFCPIIYGSVTSTGTDGSNVGGTPCYLSTSEAPFRYLVARHVCKSIMRVYRYGIVLDSSQYTVTTSIVNGITMQFINFATDQREEFRATEYEITADVQGITVDGSSAGVLIENPVSQIQHYLINYGGLTAADFDTDIVSTTEEKLVNERGAFSIIEQATHIDILNRALHSFGLSSHITRNGRLALYKFTLDDLWNIDGINPITDENDIIRDTFAISSNDEFASRIQYNFRNSWVHEYFERQPDLIDLDEEAAIGLDSRENINLWYVRDELTAQTQAIEQGYYKRENLQFITFMLPIQHFEKDLNELMRITHFQGIASNATGYNAAVFRILGLTLTLNPQQMNIECHAIRQITYENIWRSYCKLGSTAELPSDWDAATSAQKEYMFLGSTAITTGGPKGTLGTFDPIKMLF
jgi:hypothetical protein